MKNSAQLFGLMSGHGQQITFWGVFAICAVDLAVTLALHARRFWKAYRHTQVTYRALERRKPRDVWKTAIFFPDQVSEKGGKPWSPAFESLMRLLEQAERSIHACLYLTSHPLLIACVNKKIQEGLHVVIITDFDTLTAHKNFGASEWKHAGAEILYKNSGYLMHHKFLIVDNEAVITGSLNWTKQAIFKNNENLVVTTNKYIVRDYREEFMSLYLYCKDKSKEY